MNTARHGYAERGRGFVFADDGGVIRYVTEARINNGEAAAWLVDRLTDLVAKYDRAM